MNYHPTPQDSQLLLDTVPATLGALLELEESARCEATMLAMDRAFQPTLINPDAVEGWRW